MPFKRNDKNSNWFINNPKTTTFFIFCILSIAVGSLISLRYEIIKEEEEREMNNILNVVKDNFKELFAKCDKTTNTLALTINDNGIPVNFEENAKNIINSSIYLHSVQLVPKGVVKYIYPLNGNEAFLNTDLFEDPYFKDEANIALKNKTLFFAGPLNLKQGGVGIIARLPVFKNNEFWGFSSVTIKLEDLLKITGVNTIDESQYYFQFSKKNTKTKEEDFFLFDKINFKDKYYKSATLDNGYWTLYLVSKEKYNILSKISTTVILGLLFILFFAFWIYTILRKPKDLQKIISSQAEKLSNTELQFKAIFDRAPVGISKVNTITLEFIDVNEHYCKIVGYTESEIRKSGFKLITHPDDINENLEKLEQLKSGKISNFTIEKRYINNKGEVVWCNLMVSPLWKKGEEPSEHIAIIEDITDKKIYQEKMIENNKRLKSLFYDSPIPLWEEDFSEVKSYLKEINLYGKGKYEIIKTLNKKPEIISTCITKIRIIDVNNETLKLYDVDNKEIFISNFKSLVNKESIDSIKRQIITICLGEFFFEYDSIMRSKSGKKKHINIRWNVISGYEETLERVIISTEDITERIIAQENIIKSEKKLNNIINNIEGIVWEFDVKSNKLTFISDRITDILGYTKEEWSVTENFWEDHIYHEDKNWVIEKSKESLIQKSDYDFEYRMVAKNGDIIWIKDNVKVNLNRAKTASSLNGIMIDITKSKIAQEELIKSFDLVTEQNKRLLNFSYIISHNLRSHTSNILGIINILKSSEDKEEIDEMIGLLDTVSNNLNETLSHLNEVVNIRTNINLNTKNINLKGYIDKNIRVLSDQIEEKNAVINNLVSKDIMVNYNPAYLESILYNFLSNTIRYSHPDRAPIVTITFIENEKVLKISDNGIGIDLEKNADKIFGMYKTFHKNSESKGLGLFITKNQIDAMEGWVKVESEVNIGTTFTIFIK